jgi:hypothetical protein
MSYSYDTYKLLGLNPNRHLPERGMSCQFIQREFGKRKYHILIWITPKAEAAEIAKETKNRFKHRVLCNCPACGKEMSYGRLGQHIHSVTCIEKLEKESIAAYDNAVT